MTRNRNIDHDIELVLDVLNEAMIWCPSDYDNEKPSMVRDAIEVVERISVENANLKALVKRLTDVAQDLSGCTSDPGTEALAAIYCGKNLIYG
jgi:hypothetical protein